MINYRLPQVISIFALAVLMCQAKVVLPLNPTSSIASQVQWTTFVPPDEEFTAIVPGLPTQRNYPISNNPYDTKAEKILAHHEYSGYGDGLIFIIHSFKAGRPERLSGGWLIDETDVFQRIQFGNVAAELFRGSVQRRDTSYARSALRIRTAKHLYVIALITLDENNPAVNQFISGIKLRDASDQVTPVQTPAEVSSGPVLEAKDLTRRAIVVWKSEPLYTDAARAHHVIGTVRLQAVYGENGYITDITVVKELKDGLTESAIDAARNIRFFPAEKDGKRVSQRAMLEYNFNLY